MTTAENGRLFRSPFTANQWQEFEHQALIFKYMISGVPVPPELLLFPVKTSFQSRLFPHQQQPPPPPLGWGCFQMGFGRKPDPEPGRCRRTDGKKWRCSKEAYPDSKYCEKHMHRGRNRSRKPVELSMNNNSISTTNKISSYVSNTSLPSSSLELQEIAPNPNTVTYSSHGHKDYRYIDDLKEGMNERDFFTNSSINAYKSYPQQHKPQFNMTYSSTSTSSANHDPKQQPHCYILGTDFKSTPGAKSMKLEKDSDHSQKPLHHFFNDCWLDLSSSSRSNTDG